MIHLIRYFNSQFSTLESELTLDVCDLYIETCLSNKIRGVIPMLSVMKWEEFGFIHIAWFIGNDVDEAIKCYAVEPENVTSTQWTFDDISDGLD